MEGKQQISNNQQTPPLCQHLKHKAGNDTPTSGEDVLLFPLTCGIRYALSPSNLLRPLGSASSRGQRETDGEAAIIFTVKPPQN